MEITLYTDRAFKVKITFQGVLTKEEKENLIQNELRRWNGDIIKVDCYGTLLHPDELPIVKKIELTITMGRQPNLKKKIDSVIIQKKKFDRGDNTLLSNFNILQDEVKYLKKQQDKLINIIQQLVEDNKYEKEQVS